MYLWNIIYQIVSRLYLKTKYYKNLELLPLIPVVYVHGEEPGGEQDTEHGARHQDGVDGDVHLRVLDQPQSPILWWVSAKYKANE